VEVSEPGDTDRRPSRSRGQRRSHLIGRGIGGCTLQEPLEHVVAYADQGNIEVHLYHAGDGNRSRRAWSLTTVSRSSIPFPYALLPGPEMTC